MKNESTSTGYVVDLTPPRVVYVRDHPHNLHYQTSDTEMYAAWLFEDPESGVVEYRYRVIGEICCCNDVTHYKISSLLFQLVLNS